MFTFHITMFTNNAAFDDPDETKRICRKALDDALASKEDEEGYCNDSNGNTVGGWYVEYPKARPENVG